MKELGRLITAMVTPFGPGGALDLDCAQALANKLVDEGSDGLVVSGTTGESPTLTREEKIKLFAAVKEAVGDRASVIAGTGSNATADSIALSKEAEKAGVDALLVVNPYYNKPNQAGLTAHFTAIADATELPVLLYNHPGRTGVTIEASTLATLAEHPRIVGVKDSSGSLDLVTHYRLVTPPSFKIYSGDDPLTLAYLALGGCGVISVTSHVAGRDLKAMLDAWDRGDRAGALAIHLNLYELSKVLFVAPSPGPTKAALAHLGFDTGGVRLPLVPPTEAERAQVVTVLERTMAVRA